VTTSHPGRALLGDESRDRRGVVGQVRIHDDHELAGGVRQAVHVRRPETQFARPRPQQQAFVLKLALQRGDHVRGAVGGVVVHHDDLEFVVTQTRVRERLAEQQVQNPDVPPLVIRGDDHAVLRHRAQRPATTDPAPARHGE
jgi:hypothetical protein